MKAVVYRGERRVAVEDVEDPRIEAATDAIVKVTSSGICGSDLRLFEGRTTAPPGIVLGHENIGVVVQVGASVFSLRRHDRVVIPYRVACGHCRHCVHGHSTNCLTGRAEATHAAGGFVAAGPARGGQAEWLRVPFADFNCLKLPGEPDDEHEDDFLLLSDAFPTGWHATELAGVQPGSRVAVFGAGPVGLLAAHSALLRGAAEVFVVDALAARLERAGRIGAVPIDYRAGDPVDQILARRGGVSCGIAAVDGPADVLAQLVRLVDPAGRIGIVGTADRGLPRSALAKKLRMGGGQTPVTRYLHFLRDLIVAGRARPGFVISERRPLGEAAEAYRRFDRGGRGSTKVVLKAM